MVKRIKNYILVQRFDSEVKTNQYDSKKDALHSYRTTFKSAKDAFDEGGYLFIHVGLFLSEVTIELDDLREISHKKPSISQDLSEQCSFSLISDCK